MEADVSAVRRSTRKPRGAGHLRRAEILEAAERLFVAEGYEGATIRRIADEVGVSSTAIYLHFPDKSAMVREICQRAFTDLLERSQEIRARPVDALVRLRLMVAAYIRWGFDHPNAYHLVFSGQQIELDQGTQDVRTRWYEGFSELIAEIAPTGRLRVGPDAVNLTFRAAAHGLVSLYNTRPYLKWPEDREVLIAQTLDGLVHGLVSD